MVEVLEDQAECDIIGSLVTSVLCARVRCELYWVRIPTEEFLRRLFRKVTEFLAISESIHCLIISTNCYKTTAS